MAFFTNTNISVELNEWLDKSYADVVMKNHPTYGLATHKEEYGVAVRVPVKSGYSQGEATQMSDAVALNQTTLREAFVVTPNKKYRTEDVDMAQAAYSEDPEHAAVDALIDGMETCLRASAEAAERDLWGDGYGTMATILSNTNPSGNIFILTLKTTQDAWKFQKGQTLVSKATAAAASLDAATASVTGVDPIAGKIQVDGGGTWTPTNTHVLGLSKVMIASATPATFLGIPAWNPDVNNRPLTNDNLYGVNRFNNSAALAGIAIDATGQPVKQALNQLLQAMSNVGGAKVDTAFLNWSDYAKLLDDLGSQRVSISATGEMGMNYDGVKFMGPSGAVNVHPGTFVPAGRLQVCDISTLIIGAPGQFIQNKARDKFIEVPDNDTARIAIRTNGFVYISNTAAWGNALI